MLKKMYKSENTSVNNLASKRNITQVFDTSALLLTLVSEIRKRTGYRAVGAIVTWHTC